MLSKKQDEWAPDLSNPKKFRVTQRAMRWLYEKSEQSLLESDGEVEWCPPEGIIDKIWAHFRRYPFDRIRLGILRIEAKSGLMWFVPNWEQTQILEHVEKCWEKQIPARAIVLKARQVGCSTLGQAFLYCLMCVLEYKKSHLVADLREKCAAISGMWRFFYDNEPSWVRPTLVKETNPIAMEDKRMRKHICLFESAERREKTGRGFTSQFNHFSEVDWWPEDLTNQIMSSLLKCVPDQGFTLILEETTGNMMEGYFYKRFMSARNGELGDYKSFFFEWFTHKEYKMDLSRGAARGMTAEEFFESLNAQDQEMWTTYNLTAEQVNWYVWKRQEEMQGDNMTLDIFRREYPCSIEEAFLGSNSNFFEPNLLKQDAVRLSRKSGRKQVPLDEVTTCAAPFLDDNKPVHYARCSLDCDEMNLCRNPRLVDDNLGVVRVFERPRPGMPYVVTADSARGERKQKNAVGTQDWDVVDVWRVGYVEGVDAPVFVQVAQVRSQGIGPRKLAQYMVAMAEIYRDTSNYRRALMVPESNSHGMALIEEAKDLGAGSRMYQRVLQGSVNDPVQRAYGYYMAPGGGGKWTLLTAYRQAYERGMIRHMSEISVLEMQTFANRNGKLEAVPPNHDDTVITGALLLEGVKYEFNQVMPVKVDMNQQDELEGEFYQPEKIDVAKYRARMAGEPIDEFEYAI